MASLKQFKLTDFAKVCKDNPSVGVLDTDKLTLTAGDKTIQLATFARGGGEAVWMKGKTKDENKALKAHLEKLTDVADLFKPESSGDSSGGSSDRKATVKMASLGDKLTDSKSWVSFFKGNPFIEPKTVKDAIDKGFNDGKKEIEEAQAKQLGEQKAGELTVEQLQALLDAKKAEAKK